MEYRQAVEQTKVNLSDLQERRKDAVGENAIDFMNKLLTPEEIAASDLRVTMIIEIANTRAEKGISQKT